MSARRQERIERLRAKFPDITGMYRRPGPGEAMPTPSLEWMLERAERLARLATASAEASPEAKENGTDILDWIAELRHGLAILDDPCVIPIRNGIRRLISIAWAVGGLDERLYVREREHYALAGREMADARVKGGEATAGVRRADSRNWRAMAQALAEEVWQRHPGWSKAQVARQIAGKAGIEGIAVRTIREHIRKPKKVDLTLCVPPTTA
jgi:hypothetical protein